MESSENMISSTLNIRPFTTVTTLSWIDPVGAFEDYATVHALGRKTGPPHWQGQRANHATLDSGLTITLRWRLLHPG